MREEFLRQDLKQWGDTRDSLQTYSKLIGKIKQNFVPAEKHYWHLGLFPRVRGISTGPMHAGKHIINITLNLHRHCINLSRSDNEEVVFKLPGNSANDVATRILNTLSIWGASAEIDKSLFNDASELPYDEHQARVFWNNLSRVSVILQEMKAEMHEETSPLQMFPHHFDLSLTWFSGNYIDGKDRGDLDSAKEQMGLGFSTGDTIIKDAYCYVTAYPEPKAWHKTKLPSSGRWQKDGFSGAVLEFKDALKEPNTYQSIKDFYRVAWVSGKKQMMN